MGGCAGLIAELGALRSQLEGLPSENPQDIEHKAALLEETHARAWQLHILADTLSVARLHHTKVKSRRRYGGRYVPEYKNWLFQSWAEELVLGELAALDELVAGSRAPDDTDLHTERFKNGV